MPSNSNKSNKKDVTEYTEDELKVYNAQRQILFKYTFMVCIFYGSIAFIMIFIGMISQKGKQILFNDLFFFAITYIIGTIIIISWLSWSIYDFKPSKIYNHVEYDYDTCPDYWTNTYIEDPENKDADSQKRSWVSDSLDKSLFYQQCKINRNVIDINKLKNLDSAKSSNDINKKTYIQNSKYDTYIELNNDKIKNLTGLTTDADINKFKEVAANMAGYTYTNNNLVQNNDTSMKTSSGTAFTNNNIPLVCDKVFPMYLSSIDDENVKTNPSDPNNKFRCAYAKACGLTWSDVGCV